MVGLLAEGSGLECRAFRAADEARNWLGLPPEALLPAPRDRAVALDPDAELDSLP